MNCFNHTCRGQSHVKSGKVCQDSSLSWSEDGLTVAIVCDGHGGDKYFRSDRGARFASEMTGKLLSEFLRETDPTLFKGVGCGGPGEYDTKSGGALRQLFSSILLNWQDKIKEDAEKSALTEWELGNVPQSALDEFGRKENLESIYGCTLIAFAACRDYWLAFQIGDGKCLEVTGEEPSFWRMPVPWDDDCFLNVTTSLSSSGAIDKFRYCYRGDGKFPAAIFLGTDGIDDCFGEDENLANFYFRLSKEITGNPDGLQSSLENCLEELSGKGNRDDCSIACAYDRAELKKVLPLLVAWQKSVTEKEIEEKRKEKDEIESRISKLENLKKEISELEKKRNIFEEELQKLG